MIQNENQTIAQLMTDFYAKQNFYTNSETDPWMYVKVGPFRMPFPNIKARREAIRLHDLTHLLTGYDTSWTGEGEIAAWELASGFPPSLWVGYIYAPMTFVLGCVIAPKKVRAAWKRGRGQMNIYKMQMRREELDLLTVAQVRERLASASARVPGPVSGHRAS